MSKQTTVRHNGEGRAITNFRFENGIASGRISGRELSAPVKSDYRYSDDCHVTEVSNAKHFLLDYYDAIDGKRLTKKEASMMGIAALSESPIKNSHVKDLGNGFSEASAEVYGVPVTVQFKGYARNMDTGKTGNGKPWLRAAREALMEAYEKLPEDQKVPHEDTMMEFVEKEMRRIQNKSSKLRVSDEFLAELEEKTDFAVVFHEDVPIAIYEDQYVRLAQKRYGKEPLRIGLEVAIDLLEAAYDRVEADRKRIEGKKEAFLGKFA